MNEKFQRAKGMVLTEYKGMTVAELSDLRNLLRKSAIEYHVVKNTLARLAAKETSVEKVGERFKGPIGVAIGYDDSARMVKEVLEYSKKNEKLVISCGVVDGMVLDPAQLQKVASLPPREVLLGVLAGTMQAPASKMARLLSATICRLGYALSALKDKKQAA